MRRRAALVLLVVALAAGCGRKQAEAPAGEPPQWVEGRIVSVNAAEKTVTIDHKEIPGLMPAMTMSFPVQDARLLEGLAAGDAVEFAVSAGRDGLVVTHLRKR